MMTVAGKTVDFHGIAGFLMGLKPDIVSIHHRFRLEDLLAQSTLLPFSPQPQDIVVLQFS